MITKLSDRKEYVLVKATGTIVVFLLPKHAVAHNEAEILALLTSLNINIAYLNEGLRCHGLVVLRAPNILEMLKKDICPNHCSFKKNNVKCVKLDTKMLVLPLVEKIGVLFY